MTETNFQGTSDDELLQLYLSGIASGVGSIAAQIGLPSEKAVEFGKTYVQSLYHDPLTREQILNMLRTTKPGVYAISALSGGAR